METKIEIRKYEKRDFQSLATISTDCWSINHKNIAKLMLNEEDTISQCRVAVLDGNNIIGYIYGFSLPNGMLIPEFLYVYDDYRHQGIGKMLLDDLERSSGCGASMIFYNKSLRDYYEEQGYLYGDNLEVAMKELFPSEDGTT